MQYLIHIGYPKAASSLLQSTLFSGQNASIKPLNIDGKPYQGYQKSGGRLFFNERANGVDSYLDPFQFEPEQVKEQIVAATNKDAKVTCISNELWAGHPFSGGVTAKEYANRFHQVLPDAKILIVLRNQVDMIFSTYVHYVVNSYGGCSLEHFLSNNQHTQIPFHTLSYYCYDRLVQYYVDLFGEENVLVQPFEVLPKDGYEGFMTPICDFLNVEPNADFVSPEKNSANYKKYVLLKRLPFLNLLTAGGPINSYKMPRIFAVREMLLKLFSVFVSDAFIKKTIEQDKETISNFIDDEIKQSNQRLQKYVAQDLKALGYKFD